MFLIKNYNDLLKKCGFLKSEYNLYVENLKLL